MKSNVISIMMAAVMLTVGLFAAPRAESAEPIKVLLVTGQNNHDWKRTAPIFRDMIAEDNRFKVKMSTTPPRKSKDAAWANWKPDFSAYDVVVLDYFGQMFPEAQQQAFLDFVEGGGGVVAIHAANNSWVSWKEYARMIGLLWAKNDFGERVYYDDAGKLVRVPAGEGLAAGHGKKFDWTVVIRDSEHPITRGMPKQWLHPLDELYQGQRGPAKNMHILATALSDKAKAGNKASGVHEPCLWWIPYGEGRVVTNLTGHLWKNQKELDTFYCVGMRVMMQRCCEWAATGKVTIPIPDNFPTAEKTSVMEH